jgi:hypothetical protein
MSFPMPRESTAAAIWASSSASFFRWRDLLSPHLVKVLPLLLIYLQHPEQYTLGPASSSFRARAGATEWNILRPRCWSSQ